MKKNLPSILEAMALSAGLAFVPGCPGDGEEEGDSMNMPTTGHDTDQTSDTGNNEFAGICVPFAEHHGACPALGPETFGFEFACNLTLDENYEESEACGMATEATFVCATTAQCDALSADDLFGEPCRAEEDAWNEACGT